MEYVKLTEYGAVAYQMINDGNSGPEVINLFISGKASVDGSKIDAMGITEATEALGNARAFQTMIAMEAEERGLIDIDSMIMEIFRGTKSSRWRSKCIEMKMRSGNYHVRGTGRSAASKPKITAEFPPEVLELLVATKAALDTLHANGGTTPKLIGHFPPVPVGTIPGYAGVPLPDGDDGVVTVDVEDETHDDESGDDL